MSRGTQNILSVLHKRKKGCEKGLSKHKKIVVCLPCINIHILTVCEGLIYDKNKCTRNSDETNGSRKTKLTMSAKMHPPKAAVLHEAIDCWNLDIDDTNFSRTMSDQLYDMIVSGMYTT
jgi:hypothetical protein